MDKRLSRRDFIKKTSSVPLTGLFLSPSASLKVSNLKEKPEKVLNIKKYNGKLDIKTFLNPGAEYRGIPFHFYNDDIDGAEAVRQVRSMRYAGWGRVLPRRYSGLLNPTYGKDWNKAVHEVVKACKEMNMKVFLQEADKNGWYSAAPTEIPGMKDEYRNKFIIKRNADEKPAEHETLIMKKGKYAYYQHVVYPRKGWENSFCYLDLLDADVVNSYLSALFTFLDNEFGDEFGKTIEAIWVAEPHIMMGRPRTHDTLPWTPKLDEIFQNEWGYSLIEDVPKLFNDIDDYQKVRYHYWRTLSDLLSQAYSKTMQDWCKKYKLKFTGHLMGEDTFVSQLQYTANIMPHFEYMDIPGVDHLTMELDWPTGDPFIYTPKQAFSVANQIGKKEVLAELYGTSDLGNSFEDRKRVFQWMGILGINYRNYHGAFYSLRGRRKRFYPVNLNLHQPYWNENRMIADFAARLSYVLRQGQYKADALVLNSIESYYMTGKIQRRISKIVVPIHKNLIELSHNLLKIQRGYDYGCETLMAKYGRIENGKFIVGEMAYKTVILPSVDTLRKSTLKLLNDFLDAGGTILSVGTLPTTIEGELNRDIDAFNKRVIKVANEPDALQSKLNELISPDVQVNSSNDVSTETIWVQHRILDNGQLFYMTNTSTEKTIEAEVMLKGNGKLEYWNLESGKIECVPQKNSGKYIKTKLEFAPNGAHLLFLNEEAKQVNIAAKSRNVVSQIPVNSFNVTRDDPNSMTLDFCRYKKGSGEWSDVLPVLGVTDILNKEKYNGPVTLQFDFTSEIKSNKCAVVIEEADKYSVEVNGMSVKYEGLPFYREKCFLPIDITHHIKTGINRIQISRTFEAEDKDNLDNENLHKYYGTELEQVYLIGDFAVKGKRTGQDFFECRRERFNPKFVMAKESGITGGNLLTDGYCFFNGTINLTTNVIIPEVKKNERYFIDFGELDTTIAKVKVNNQDAGKIAWKPYRADITDYIWEGENKIEISLTNSLRNLMGSLHYIPSLDAKAGQWSQKASPAVGDGPEWYKNRDKNKHWSDDYFFRSFGVGSHVSITCVKYS